MSWTSGIGGQPSRQHLNAFLSEFESGLVNETIFLLLLCQDQFYELLRIGISIWWCHCFVLLRKRPYTDHICLVRVMSFQMKGSSIFYQNQKIKKNPSGDHTWLEWNCLHPLCLGETLERIGHQKAKHGVPFLVLTSPLTLHENRLELSKIIREEEPGVSGFKRIRWSHF